MSFDYTFTYCFHQFLNTDRKGNSYGEQQPKSYKTVIVYVRFLNMFTDPQKSVFKQ